jgi:hypothetical protein
MFYRFWPSPEWILMHYSGDTNLYSPYRSRIKYGINSGWYPVALLLQFISIAMQLYHSSPMMNISWILVHLRRKVYIYYVKYYSFGLSHPPQWNEHNEIQ